MPFWTNFVVFNRSLMSDMATQCHLCQKCVRKASIVILLYSTSHWTNWHLILSLPRNWRTFVIDSQNPFNRFYELKKLRTTEPLIVIVFPWFTFLTLRMRIHTVLNDFLTLSAHSQVLHSFNESSAFLKRDFKKGALQSWEHDIRPPTLRWSVSEIDNYICKHILCRDRQN